MASEETTYDHLAELGGSDYEIKDGEPNIKGWDVLNEQGQRIGEVDELLFDPQSQKVRYLIVDIDDDELGLNDKKVLIPIGVAELHESKTDDEENKSAQTSTNPTISPRTAEDQYSGTGNKKRIERLNIDDDDDLVILPVTREQLAALPAYKKGTVTPQMELTIRGIFEEVGAVGATAYSKDKFYDHAHFNEDNFYDKGITTTLPVIEENLKVGKLEEQTGGARITSRIVQRPVQQNINLREEHVTVDRNPVNRPVLPAEGNAFKEEELELTEHAEVPVVSKEARVVEEVTLNKEVKEKEETIKDTVRSTEVETERINSNKNSNEL